MQDLPALFQLDDGMTWRGGQQQVLYLHQGLLALDHDSRVICRRGSQLHHRLETEKLPHYALPIGGGHDLGAAWRIGSVVRGERGILHAHSSHAHDLALWAARLRGLRRLVVSRRFDAPVPRNWMRRRKYLDPRIRRFLAISSAVESNLRAAGVDETRLVRVPSGVDLSRFETVEPDWAWRGSLANSLGLRTGELLFGNVAALAPEKDQATLLEAFARFRARGGEGRLVVLGEGDQRAALESRREALGLGEHVALPGFADPVLPRLAALDIFVLSSTREALGTSILDAMALRRPVIATSTGGIVDLVTPDATGLLVPPGDADALAEALLRLQKDAALRHRLGEAGATRARDFDVRITVDKTIEAYRALLAEEEGTP